MQLNLLHVDDALLQQPLLVEKCANLGARQSNVAHAASLVRLWGKASAITDLKRDIATSLPYGGGRDTVVTFMGSGDFHHVSALLIELISEKQEAPFTIIHFDNHPDWVHFSGGMHCGSWVNRALASSKVSKVITLGVCSKDLKWPQFKGANLKAWQEGKIVLLPWHSTGAQFSKDNIENISEAQLLTSLDRLITTNNVYITIDKDVLSQQDAITNWDQGRMPLPRLLTIIRHILARHHAVGIDINGDYSTPHYSGKLHHTVLKKLEALIDQPKQDISNATAINQASNLAILGTLMEAL